MRVSILLAALVASPPMAMGLTPSYAASRDPAAQRLVDELLAVDQGFANRAAGRSAVEAIAALLDQDAAIFIVPHPHLALGKAEAVKLLGQAFAGDASALSWAPVRAGISADGMNGFTYGFVTRTTAGKPPALAKYLSYWVKRPEGWRVAAYKLVPRPVGEVDAKARPAALPERIVAVRPDAVARDRYRAELDRAERSFSDEAQVIGLAEAFRKYGSADAMNVGGEADFTYGNDAIAAGFGPDQSSPLRWAPDGVHVAASGDLGFTYGYLERNGATPPGRPSRIPWFTVWRRNSPEEPWRYIAE